MPSATIRLSLPFIHLEVFLLIHFFLFIFGNITYPSGLWMPIGYEWSNGIIIGAGIWAIVEAEKSAPALFFFFTVLINIIHEIVFLALYFINDTSILAPGDQRRTWQFSAAMAVINHIIKYVTLVFAYHAFTSRGGSLKASFSKFRADYEPVSGSVEADGDPAAEPNS